MSDLDKAFTGTCEDCGKKGVKVRRVKALGMFKESRGYYDICFECHGPQVYFKSRNGRMMQAPMRKKEGSQ